MNAVRNPVGQFHISLLPRKALAAMGWLEGIRAKQLRKELVGSQLPSLALKSLQLVARLLGLGRRNLPYPPSSPTTCTTKRLHLEEHLYPAQEADMDKGFHRVTAGKLLNKVQIA